MTRSKGRKPVSVDLDDPAILFDEPETDAAIDIELTPEPPHEKKSAAKKRKAEDTLPESGTDLANTNNVATTTARISSRLTRWGGVLISSLGALVTLAAGLAATELVESLFARADWLGWLALGLTGLVALALLAIVVREITSLTRIRKLGRLHDDAARIARDGTEREARGLLAQLKQLYRRRDDLKWPLARLRDAERDVYDAPDLIMLAERELMKDLDRRAAAEIARTAKRVSVVTAVSPAALIDIGFVLASNMSLLRKLAALYGGRPGTLGLLKLARMVIAHLTVTGGIALGDSLLQQVFGHGVAAKLSARLGEGVINGLFTSRIGLAALEVCRPLPFKHLPAPTIRNLMSEVVSPSK